MTWAYPSLFSPILSQHGGPSHKEQDRSATNDYGLISDLGDVYLCVFLALAYFNLRGPKLSYLQCYLNKTWIRSSLTSINNITEGRKG